MNSSILFVVLIATSLSLSAGGWLQGKKNTYLKLSQSVIRGNQFFDGKGNQNEIVTTGVYQTSLYIEHGLSDKFDGIFYMPLVSRLTLNDVQFSSGRFQEGDEFTSIGDADIGIKYGIRQNRPLVISASLTFGIPSGSTSGGDTELLQTGDGEFNQLLMVEVGYGFKAPLYASVGVGFNNRTKDFSEEFRFNAELGYTHKKKLNVALKLAVVESFMNGDAKGSGGNGIFSNNLEFVSFSPELSYQFSDQFGISASYATAASGQLILAEPSYNFGVFMKLD